MSIYAYMKIRQTRVSLAMMLDLNCKTTFYS